MLHYQPYLTYIPVVVTIIRKIAYNIKCKLYATVELSRHFVFKKSKILDFEPFRLLS